MRFEPIGTVEQIKQLAEIADVIWHDYWPAIIGEEQTDYMVDTLQSFEPLYRDIKDTGYEYWFLIDDSEGEDRTVGYIGGVSEPEKKRFFISKIYLFSSERGKGYASRVIKFFNRLASMRQMELMYLTVNKHNEMAIQAYKHLGFETVKSVESPIGKGFIMDDYVMERKIETMQA